MGNCVFKGNTTSEGVSDEKVVTSNGGIMELYTPITAERITNEFSGHGIFRSRRDLLSEPLHHDEELHAGELYYLLPLDPSRRKGVWKVKLVISPEQLSEILSQESRTEAFVESLRTVAKCGSGLPLVPNSDHSSVSITDNQGLHG
uniref:Uncharacterized protein n=1 Tax=Cajanus cajan TaxID=3821 RepID=A0A151TY65_CAJCA|nr:hypothetical protein KK1_011275 [Cajanus cajan]